MLAGLMAGETDPKALADLALGKLHQKRPDWGQALNGRMREHLPHQH